MESICHDTLVEQSRSPTQDYTVVMLARRCGPTTTVTRHVQLLRGSEVPSMNRKSVLSVKDTTLWVDTTSQERDRHREILRITAQWLSGDTLVMTVDPRAKSTEYSSVVKGLHIIVRERSQ